MSRNLFMSAIALAIASTASPAWSDSPAPAKAIMSLRWQDVDGRSWSMANSAKNKATVFCFVSTECPISNLYVPRISELISNYSAKGAKFYVVDSNEGDTAARLKKYASERSLHAPVIRDRGNALADALGARVTPEIVIVDSHGTALYLGRIDDNQDRSKIIRRDAKEALESVLSGSEVRFPRTLSAGCLIFRQKSEKQPSQASSSKFTYSKDIAPILNATCVVCHRNGEVAPFAIENFRQAHTWAMQIKEYTSRGIMPPWKASAGHYQFRDVRKLTAAQIETIAKWADAGAVEGNPSDLPSSPKFRSPEQWALGPPDRILSAPRPYHLAAEGPDVYRNFVLPIDFEKDTYFSAMEFKPGNRSIVHHIVTYIDPTGKTAQLDGKDSEPGYSVPGTGIGTFADEWGEVWVPGRTPHMLPPGIAIRVPKGAKMVMQVHYHKNGAPQADQSKMAVYFAKEPVTRPMIVAPIGNMFINLAPGKSGQILHGLISAPVDLQLRTIFPHMHLLGKSMKVTAKFPSGELKTLMDVQDWDFNWQETYEYTEPILIPKGTRLELTAEYDNSDKNPHQLVFPPKLVTFGEQTTDEMCFAFLGFTTVQPTKGTRRPGHRFGQPSE